MEWWDGMVECLFLVEIFFPSGNFFCLFFFIVVDVFAGDGIFGAEVGMYFTGSGRQYKTSYYLAIPFTPCIVTYVDLRHCKLAVFSFGLFFWLLLLLVRIFIS